MFWRFDEQDGAFLQNELQSVYNTAYEVDYTGLRARTFIPKRAQLDDSALYAMQPIEEGMGEAQLVVGKTTDLPRVDVRASSVGRPVRAIATSYGYSFQEIRFARKTGANLEARRALKARRAIETVIDRVAAVGDKAESGIQSGFCNDSKVPVVTLDGAETWQSLDPKQLIDFVATAYTSVVEECDTVVPDTLLLPPAQATALSTRTMRTGSDTTIRDFMLSSLPTLRAIEPWSRLKGAGEAGTDRAILYERNEQYVFLEVPLEFMQLPVQASGLDAVVPCVATTCGAFVVEPKSMVYIDGI